MADPPMRMAGQIEVLIVMEGESLAAGCKVFFGEDTGEQKLSLEAGC